MKGWLGEYISKQAMKQRRHFKTQEGREKAHRPAKKYIELLPASLLPFKKEWQAISHHLPAGTCLIILPDDNTSLGEQIRIVAQIFESRGRRVEILREADIRPDEE